MKALGILGSPRRHGNSAKMLECAMEALSNEGFETEIIYLQERKINYCTGCGTCLATEKCAIADDMIEIKEKISKSSALILSSPVYYLNVTAQMKTFIDRMLSFGHRPSLRGYGGAIVSYAGVGDAELVAKYLNRILKAWGIFPVGYAICYGVLPGEVGGSDLEKARELGKAVAKACMERKAPIVEKEDIFLQEQLLKLIRKYGYIMKADYDFWKKKGKID